MAASYVVWALSHNFTLFVIARIIGGLSKGNISLSTAIVADILPSDKRGKGMVRIVIYLYMCLYYTYIIEYTLCLHCTLQKILPYSLIEHIVENLMDGWCSIHDLSDLVPKGN